MDIGIVSDGQYFDSEEQSVMESEQAGEWTKVTGHAAVELGRKLQAAARAKVGELEIKSERMNIRMTKRDMEELKRVAQRDGLPYQSLVASVLHKFTEGRLVDIDEARKLLVAMQE